MSNLKVITPDEITKEESEKRADGLVATNRELANLTTRRRRLIEIMLADPGKPFIQAAKEAGYSLTSKAKASALKKQIQGKLSSTLKALGVFEIDLAKVLHDGLNATKVVFLTVKDRDDKGKVIGERIQPVEVPDHTIRLQTLTRITQLGDYFPNKKLDINVSDNRPFANINPELLEQRARELSEKVVDAEYEVVDSERQAEAG